MNDIIEDGDNDKAGDGLPTWAWAGSVILITLALLSYILFY